MKVLFRIRFKQDGSRYCVARHDGEYWVLGEIDMWPLARSFDERDYDVYKIEIGATFTNDKNKEITVVKYQGEMEGVNFYQVSDENGGRKTLRISEILNGDF